MAIATLADVTRRQHAERPDEVAIVFPAGNRQWSYQQLDVEACHWVLTSKLAEIDIIGG